MKYNSDLYSCLMLSIKWTFLFFLIIPFNWISFIISIILFLTIFIVNYKCTSIEIKNNYLIISRFNHCKKYNLNNSKIVKKRYRRRKRFGRKMLEKLYKLRGREYHESLSSIISLKFISFKTLTNKTKIISLESLSFNDYIDIGQKIINIIKKSNNDKIEFLERQINIYDLNPKKIKININKKITMIYKNYSSILDYKGWNS